MNERSWWAILLIINSLTHQRFYWQWTLWYMSDLRTVNTIIYERFCWLLILASWAILITINAYMSDLDDYQYIHEWSWCTWVILMTINTYMSDLDDYQRIHERFCWQSMRQTYSHARTIAFDSSPYMCICGSLMHMCVCVRVCVFMYICKHIYLYTYMYYIVTRKN